MTPPPDVTVLKLIAHGRDPQFIADSAGIAVRNVFEIAAKHGARRPNGEIDLTACAHAAVELERKINARPDPPRPAPVNGNLTARKPGQPYIAALHCDELFADPAYQRELDEARVKKMTKEYDPTLVGVLEVSARGGSRYAIIDGQHRWAMLTRARRDGGRAPVVCNVHTGLTVEDEARLFYEIDAKRRRLTGWDRWNARRGSGDPAVLDIERVAAEAGLNVGPSTVDGTLRCVSACEKVVRLGGLQLLEHTLAAVTGAYGKAADGLVAEIVHGTAHVLAYYDQGELDRPRLVGAMQGIAPRQVVARAAALREVSKGEMPRLVAAVLVDAYNREPGRNVDPFPQRVPARSRVRPGKHGPEDRKDAERAKAAYARKKAEATA